MRTMPHEFYLNYTSERHPQSTTKEAVNDYGVKRFTYVLSKLGGGAN